MRSRSGMTNGLKEKNGPNYSRMLSWRSQFHQNFFFNHVAIVVNRMNKANAVGAVANHGVGHIEIGEVAHQLPTIVVEPPNFELLPMRHKEEVAGYQFPVAN